MTAPDEHAILSRAVMALGDKIAAELRACEEILKTEADIGRRRSAQARYMTLTDKQERAA